MKSLIVQCNEDLLFSSVERQVTSPTIYREDKQEFQAASAAKEPKIFLIERQAQTTQALVNHQAYLESLILAQDERWRRA